MTTVIDSLVVTLGLDPTQFSKGQREALDAFKKTQEEAVKGGKAVEEQSKRSMDALGGIKTQALELFAVFTGGKGLIEFAAHTVTTNAELGRLSRNLNISAETLSKWQGAARIFGGDAGQMATTFTAISDAVEGFKIGKISPLIADFRALGSAGGTIIDINKGVDQTLLDISANLAKVNAVDPARAGLLGRMIGLDPGLYDLLVKGPKATQEMLDRVNQLGPATKAATDAAGELERRWNSIGVKADAFGRKVLNSGVGNQVTEAADFLNLSPGEAMAKFWSRSSWAWLLGGDETKSATTAAAGSGPFKSQSEKEAFIRSEAVKRGQNPDVWMKLTKGEGYSNYYGDLDATGKPTSFGAMQLHYAGVGRNTADGLGTIFTQQTGKDARDPATERDQVAWSMDWAATHGLGAWHGWHGAPFAHLQGGPGGSTTTSSVVINGPINVYPPPGADGTAIAGKFTETLKRQSFAAQANDGQN